MNVIALLTFAVILLVLFVVYIVRTRNDYPVLCAWCKTAEVGRSPVPGSHGICKPCAEALKRTCGRRTLTGFELNGSGSRWEYCTLPARHAGPCRAEALLEANR